MKQRYKITGLAWGMLDKSVGSMLNLNACGISTVKMQRMWENTWIFLDDTVGEALSSEKSLIAIKGFCGMF